MPKRMTMFKKSKAIIRWLLKNPWIRPMCIFNYAAVILQKIFRGYLVRKNWGVKGSNWKKYLQSKKDKRTSHRKRKQAMLTKYLTTMDYYRSNPGLRMPFWLVEGYSSWCTVRIQAWWRMIRQYQYYQRQIHVFFRIASMDIQAAWRHHKYIVALKLGRTRIAKTITSYDHGAQIIQLNWRSFCSRRIYGYFRDLLKYKLQGEPLDLLRTIAPGEAHLLDRAAGIHVRFRLGGVMFPPKIYFKIYTHRPLCDVNSFAPRNYTCEVPAGTFQSQVKPEGLVARVKQHSTIKVGSRSFETSLIMAKNMDQWYRREENNEWRTISSQKVEELFEPPSFMTSAFGKKSIKHFHYSRLQRRQDVVKERKRLKREWMMKAYMLTASGNNPSRRASPESPGEREKDRDMYGEREGLRGPRSGDREEEGKDVSEFESSGLFASEGREGERGDEREESGERGYENERERERDSPPKHYAPSNNLHSRAKAPMIAVASHEPVAVAGSDEDLLMWSMALDFDSYADDWMSLGTSLPSDIKFRRKASSMYHK